MRASFSGDEHTILCMSPALYFPLFSLPFSRPKDTTAEK